MINRRYWLTLSQSTRKNLAEVLNIPRTGGITVEDNIVTSDGYTDHDLMSVDVVKLQEVVQSDSTDFYALLETLIDRIEEMERQLAEAEKVIATPPPPLEEYLPPVVVTRRTLYPRPQDQKVKVLVPAKNKGGRPKTIKK